MSAAAYDALYLGSHLTIWDQTVECELCGEAWWGENCTDDPTLFHKAECRSFGRHNVAEYGLNVPLIKQGLGGRQCGVDHAAPLPDQVAAWRAEVRRQVTEAAAQGHAAHALASRLLQAGGATWQASHSLRGRDLTDYKVREAVVADALRRFRRPGLHGHEWVVTERDKIRQPAAASCRACGRQWNSRWPASSLVEVGAERCPGELPLDGAAKRADRDPPVDPLRSEHEALQRRYQALRRWLAANGNEGGGMSGAEMDVCERDASLWETEQEPPAA